MPRTSRTRLLAPLLALAIPAACATGTSAGSMATMANMYGAEPHVRSSSDILAAAEIARAPGGGGSAYDVVLRLRPQFLTARAVTFSPDPYAGRPVVYLDGIRLGGIEELRTISASMVGEIRFLSAVAGSAAFGRYHPGGVIAIRSRR